LILAEDCDSALEVHRCMEHHLLGNGGEVHNFVATIREMGPSNYTLETELFPLPALEAYARYNLGGPFPADFAHWCTLDRGGPQGDYREGMLEKIDSVVETLGAYPGSKRAALTVPGVSIPHHAFGPAWKCLREVYFRVEDGRLHATGVMRSQALSIFPKNAFMIGRLMETIAARLGCEVGSYTHFAHFLVSDRS
jgi:hypothetical protein